MRRSAAGNRTSRAGTASADSVDAERRAHLGEDLERRRLVERDPERVAVDDAQVDPARSRRRRDLVGATRAPAR